MGVNVAVGDGSVVVVGVKEGAVVGGLVGITVGMSMAAGMGVRVGIGVSVDPNSRLELHPEMIRLMANKPATTRPMVVI